MLGWLVVSLLSVLGKEVIIMETFLEFFREVLTGIVREVSCISFSGKCFRKQENHPTPSQAKGGSQKNKLF